MKQIAIKCDLSNISGLGHFKRMLGLYNELIKINCKCKFILSKDQKDIIKKLGDNIDFLVKQKKVIKDNTKFSDFLINEKFNAVILDSYFDTTKLEILLKNKSEIKIIKISDDLEKSYADLIFTNKEISGNKRDERVFSGFKYALTSIKNKKVNKKVNKKINIKKLKVLFHGGGSDIFKNLNIFLKSTYNYYLKGKIDLDILVIKKKTKNYLIKLFENSNTIPKFIHYTNNINKNLKNYDVVCGPLGTTTFETILSGSLPFTVEPFKSKNFCNLSWIKNGHLFYLNHNESKKEKVLNNLWDFLLLDFKRNYKYLLKNSSKLDGLANKRVAKTILKYLQSRKINFNFYKPRNNISKSKIEDSRKVLEIRNQLNNRNASASPKHIIYWPEHLKWWFNKEIFKYSYYISGKMVGMHWIRKVSDNNGSFLVSGWTTDNSLKNRLFISNKLLSHQNKTINKKFKNSVWIIIQKKTNLL